MRIRLLFVTLLMGCRITDAAPIAMVYVTPNAWLDPTRITHVQNPDGSPNRVRTAGDSIQLFAVALTTDNRVIRWRDATWASSDTGVATVSSRGLVRVRGLGTVRISATIDYVPGWITYVLPDCTIDVLTVMPSTATIGVGGTQRFVATSMTRLPVECSGSVVWSLSGTSVASIDSTGLATGLAPGQTTVIASWGASPSVHGGAVLTVK